MELVLDDEGRAVLKDGLPVYKYEDGSESPFDAAKTMDNYKKRIENLEQEKTRHFTKSEDLKKELKAYKGIDPKSAQEAIETMKNLKGKELLDANGIKALKADMRESFDTELSKVHSDYKKLLDEKDTVIGVKENTIKHQAITQKFANSEFFTGEKPRTIYPPEDAVRIFSHRFFVDGEGPDIVVLGKDKEGNVMMSQKNHGDPADFDEAMARIIEEHPNKARILNTQKGGPLAGGNLEPGKDGEYASSVDRIAAGLKRQHPDKFSGV